MERHAADIDMLQRKKTISLRLGGVIHLLRSVEATGKNHETMPVEEECYLEDGPAHGSLREEPL